MNDFSQKESVRQSKSHYDDIRKKLREYLDLILKNYPINICEEEILTLNKLAEKFRVSKPFVIDYLKKYLKSRYSKKEMINIKENLWPQGTLANKIKRDNFFQSLNEYLNLYPNDISKIPSLQELADMINVERNTITDWIKKYLVQEFGLKESSRKFKEIWTSRQGGKDVRLKYEKLESFIKSRRGLLLTSKEEFESMKLPNQQHINIVCEGKHTFSPQILHVLYHNQWCPTCKEFFCQKVMRLYMESIFKTEFPETSLKKAYGFSSESGGQLRWDGYSNKVIVKGENLKVSFEYDGLQHDKWPNWIHLSLEDFEKQQENDQKKSSIADNPDHKTIVIRLKEINGFNRKTTKKFQKEILNQFYAQTGLKIPFNYALEYDPFTDSLTSKNGGLDGFLARNLFFY